MNGRKRDQEYEDKKRPSDDTGFERKEKRIDNVTDWEKAPRPSKEKQNEEE